MSSLDFPWRIKIATAVRLIITYIDLLIENDLEKIYVEQWRK